MQCLVGGSRKDDFFSRPLELPSTQVLYLPLLACSALPQPETYHDDLAVLVSRMVC